MKMVRVSGFGFVSLFLMVGKPSATDANFSTAQQCNTIVESGLRSKCLSVVSQGASFPFTTEFQKSRQPAMDTTITRAIRGEDTTLVFSISPSCLEGNLKPEAESMAMSLRFMAVITGISLALSIATLVVAATK